MCRARRFFALLATTALALCGVGACLQSADAAELRLERVATSEGPSYDSIHDIIRDQLGFLWLATANGLVRYDGYEFRRFLHDPSDSTSISGNHIWSLHQDGAGDLWVGTSGRGLNRMVYAETRFERIPSGEGPRAIRGYHEITSIVGDREGAVWIAEWEKGLDRYDPATGRFDREVADAILEREVGGGSPHRLHVDRRGELWIGTNRGVIRHEPDADRYQLYRNSEDANSLAGDYIYAMVEDARGQLWLGANSGGLSRYDRERDVFDRFRHDPEDPSSLRDNCVLSLAAAADGSVWVGTASGVDRYDPVRKRFERVEPRVAGELTVTALHIDRDGIVWVGTEASGLYRHHPAQQKFAHHREGLGSVIVDAILEHSDGSVWIGGASGSLDQVDPDGTIVQHGERIGHESVFDIEEDAQGALWLAFRSGGLAHFEPRSGKLRRFRHDPDDASTIASDELTCLTLDALGRVWWGSDGGGVGYLEPASGRVTNLTFAEDAPLPDILHVFEVFRASDGRIWFGSWGGGATAYDPRTNAVESLLPGPERSNSIAGDVVVAIAESPQGVMWFGTWGEGLTRYDLQDRSFKNYTAHDGLPNDIVFALLPDASGRVWVSTTGGFARFDPMRRSWRHYDLSDGLQSMVFRQGSAHAGRSGRLYFGGTNGYNSFEPGAIRDRDVPPRVVVTSLELGGVELLASPLAGSLVEPLARVPHREDHLSAEFAALDFTQPLRNQYAYRLVGVDDEWVEAGSRRIANYAHLRPGKYRLELRAANGDGAWTEAALSVPFEIAMPLWRTPMAYVVYVLALVLALLWLRQVEVRRMRLSSALEFERVEAAKLRDLDEAKSRFFANVSHEFRTPLTLILGPLERLQRGENQDPSSEYGVIRRNALKLLALIDQVLELSKLEASQMDLKLQEVDLRELCRSSAASFRALAEARGLEFALDLPPHIVAARIDVDRIDKCLNNLLSNAVKFTPAGGSISLRLLLERESSGRNAAVLEISDNGVGIPADAVSHVFDRFYQGPIHALDASPGTGIGLALTREIVSLHGGSIAVESAEGEGTLFRVRLQASSGEQLVHTTSDEPLEEMARVGQERGDNGSRPVILVVEDHSDMCDHIRRELSSEFEILEAQRGDTGLQLCLERMPDLVISDVMMPGLDGFELCRALRADTRTSHIPIVMLTARATEDDRVTGIELGADDYLAKPFSGRELRARVQNLIRVRRELRERFQSASMHPIELALTSADTEFMERLMGIVTDNIDDPEFNVEAFAREVGMSRMHLHRKVKALTGQSCSDFLRTIRLRAAAEQLSRRTHTVTEVAYAVGFKTPTHFATAFRKQYGKTPSDYAKGG